MNLFLRRDVENDYARAQKAILNAVTTVEDKIQKVVAAEVDTLFHEQKHHPKTKTDVSAKAQKVVETGARKVKKAVDDHTEKHIYPFEDHPYPYAFPQINEKGKPHKHKDHRILHAIETAEKAVLHAIEEEVDTIFHEMEHHDDADKEAVSKAKAKVKEGVKKAATSVKDDHEKRRGWLSEDTEALIEDYVHFTGI